MPRSSTEKLDSGEVLQRHLKALIRRDPRLRTVAKQAGEFDLRLSPTGFAGLARVVCGQQLSVASARAIWGRFEQLKGALEPKGFLRLKEETVRATGFSASKYRTVRTIAEAAVAGELDFAHVETLDAAAAVAYLTTHKGIGPWTAEIYLMFCMGHPDVFPAGDLALRKAVAHALGLDEPPPEKELVAIAAPWAPYRHTAALLFWKYYAAVLLRKAEGSAI